MEKLIEFGDSAYWIAANVYFIVFLVRLSVLSLVTIHATKKQLLYTKCVDAESVHLVVSLDFDELVAQNNEQNS